ncbi:putative HTH-type transcriptional regulator YdfH [Microbacterium hydrocarbonoxydans]|uniref:Putative HTH-type transcriptional regulator YdfH n=1 Tax=Microbacterium hydrocarbonoxydans TaxID=273678 RepID=A0A0M2HV80_9MICO|nr:GntR family transcriptional regulator [Microbacterium hydrocarbonoxydans]KJL48353.1 putative HTH-type transcriptional regulator YdfH [Microbacterium hydrocarbonoxydans]
MSETSPRPSARAVAYGRIRDDIIGGRFAPGALLSENELAAALGISRQPVREALLLIAQEGLVEVRPQSGTYVTHIDPDRVREAQFIREAIELASLAACAAPAEEDERMLRDVIARQRTASDRDAFYPLDEEFHRALLGLAGHANAWAAVSAAKGHLDRARYVGMSATRGVQDYVDDHERVVDALAAGDMDAAADALREHLRFVFADLEAVREGHPELFEGAPAPRTGRPSRR